MTKPAPTIPESDRVVVNATRALLLAGAVFALLVAPAHAIDAYAWRHRQALAVETAGMTKVALPPATLDLARPALEDLRLLDTSGRELPFVLERAAPSVPSTVRAPRSFRATLSERATELIIHTGAVSPLATILLSTPAPSFLKAATIEISADGARWETLRSGAPLFRQFGAEELALDLEHRTAAQVRITVDDTRTRPVPFTAATLFLVTTVQPPLTTPLPARIANREEFAGETVLTLDLGARHVPLAALEFVTAEPLFARKVTLAIRELQDDTPTERTLATSSIYRVAADGLVPSADLEVAIDAAVPTRELLVHLINHDSPPLAIDDIRVHQRPIWLVFRATQPGSYTLLTGNPDAAAPRYDLALLAGALRDASPTLISPGAPELNPDYRRTDALANTALVGGAIDPRAWAFRKTVGLGSAGVQQLELDFDVLARAQPGFADLRLVRQATQIPYLLEQPGLSRTIPLVTSLDPDPKQPRLTRWKVALPRAGLPATRLTLVSNTPLFERHVRVRERLTDDRGNAYDRSLGEAAWRKAPGASETFVLTLTGTPQSDTLLLETDNGDNPPIALASVRAHYSVARLLFKVDAPTVGRQATDVLALYYGNRQAATPRYDVRLVAAQILNAEKNVATLGDEEKARPDGWATAALAKARGGPLFWSALALVVVVLLAVMAKLLPKPQQ